MKNTTNANSLHLINLGRMENVKEKVEEIKKFCDKYKAEINVCIIRGRTGYETIKLYHPLESLDVDINLIYEYLKLCKDDTTIQH